MVALLLVLPGPHELVHRLQPIPFLVVLAVLDVPLKGLDDGVAQLQVGLQLQGLRLHLIPAVEQYLEKIGQPCPGGLDGLHLGDDDPLL